MERRKMEKLGIETSLLGFGCMRFPVTAEGKIDEPLAEKMLDKAIAEGVNYIDTAYPYHSGESERFVGKVLKKYDRSSFYLATKLPCWKVEKIEDVDTIFEEQLQKLQTDYVDFYLVHAMNKERFDKMVEIGFIKRLEELKAEGKIKYLGFSFHDEYSVFEQIIHYWNWDFCQIQLNYMDGEKFLRRNYLQKKIDSIDGTLIATKYTISNNLYNCKNVLNCSNLVEYIEGRGQINKDFFNSFKGNLFLGCTHFTLVKNRFSNYCIDSVEELANNLAFTKSKLKINIYVTKLNKNIYNHILYYLHSTNFYIKLINI